MTDKTKNTLIRLLSALVALPVYVYAICTDSMYNIPILLVSIIISLVTLYEFYLIADRGTDGKPVVFIGLVFGLCINLVMYFYAFGETSFFQKSFTGMSGLPGIHLLLGIMVLVITVILVKQVFQGKIKGATFSISSTLFGNIYIVLFFSHILLMKSLEHGVFYIIILNIIVMINDTAAYFGGWLFGKHKTKLEVSPNKTWEGYISGFIISILFMFVCNEAGSAIWHVSLFGTIEALLLGAVLSVLGFVGDLVESLIKRDAVKKDSGNIIPGHGGMWDSFDALIFTLPLFYYYLILKGVL